jgi:hypothetical protein
MRYGGERTARKHLEDAAIRPSWSEPYLIKILENRVVRLLSPLAAYFVEPAARQGDTIPWWFRR